MYCYLKNSDSNVLLVLVFAIRVPRTPFRGCRSCIVGKPLYSSHCWDCCSRSILKCLYRRFDCKAYSNFMFHVFDFNSVLGNFTSVIF